MKLHATPGLSGVISKSIDTRRAGRYMRLADHLCGCALHLSATKAKLVGTPVKFRNWIDDTTPGVAAKVHEFLSKKGDELAAFIVNGMLAHKVHKSLTDDELKALLEKYNWDSWDAIIGILDDDFYDAYFTAAEEQLKVLGMNADEDIVNQVDDRAKEYARQQSASLVGKRILRDGTVVDNPDVQYSITDTTRESLRQLTERAIDEGMSTDDLAELIRTSHSFSEERSTTIARTELADSHVQGNLAGWEESGIVQGKRSILGSEHGPDDHDQCDDNAEAGIIGLDENFPSGDFAPPYHPNCICDLEPILMDGV